ncbi:hypothetical protein GCM10007103_34540 [Salinimicrobium marinum]|uniref:histidine kinase n=1 Tax=Salinimicrobium marinum TaxID=680283 RepID=A0A918W0G6_9FLAO|nr:HAMP domain-containing sensor histidine kinase [Salinimicrobium marinum]GHA50867.1 hypothetical protein GCM10007103_34540 [Salinimicrobium marinum]
MKNEGVHAVVLNSETADELLAFHDNIPEETLQQIESRESDNVRLQAEKEVAEKQLFINRIFIAALVLVILFLLVLALQFRNNSRQKEIFNSELKEKNRTILEQNHIISQQNEELSEMNQAKNRLFSILSHDLRSPIGSLQQLLELIQSGDFTPEEQSGLLDEMLVQVTGTSSMLHNLLHWANSQLEGDKVTFEEVNIPKKVSRVVDAYYLVAKSKNIKIIQEEPKGLPKIQVDKGHLSVILHNLLSNALKYTIEGKEIKITYAVKNDQVLLKFLDGGQGISEKKIKEIKNLNSRMISQVGTGMETGTGIGLMLVKHFLNINRASLDVKSYRGEGSEFIVAFKKAGIN